MFWIALVLVWCPAAWSHVALTFPPARKYDLDFLDSFRTTAPCGMPKGNIKTTIPAGKKIEITWHLGYPHQGGYRIELLNKEEKPLMNLTGDSGYIEGDATAQTYEMELPQDIVCNDCSIRLVRQAREWGRRYQFWSCADVDIIPSQDYRETCSNHGRVSANQCTCDSRFHGDQCQYENECEEDRDCGKYGKCIGLDATTYPKKQCFCERGYFGTRCSKESPLTSTKLNFDSYSQRKLSDDFTAYWKILENSDEIEVVLKVQGTSYAALGWKPTGLRSSCQQFPYIPDSGYSYQSLESDAESEAESEPESENEAHAEGEPESEADAHAEGEPESETEAHAEGEPEYEAEAHAEGEPESEAEAHAEGEPESEAEAHAEGEPESEAEAHAEGEPESETEAHAEAEPEGYAETQPEGKPKGPRRSRYTPRSRIHAMDCTDMVIGMARGRYSRVMDYYTRDRSTPKVDSFWGGDDDLTAAVGEEENGVTTIAFRKKILANGESDHTIEDNLMTVIWAKGQEPGNYIHRPRSGLEAGGNSIDNFYRPDELKYHGHADQRGTLTLNLMEAKPPVQPNRHCRGEWKYPSDCTPPSCEYRAAWDYQQEIDSVAFTIQTTNVDTWTGIGFSTNQRMDATDAVLGWNDEFGPYLVDTWLNGYNSPTLDEHPMEHLGSVNVASTDGATTIHFTRKRNTGDPQDLSLSNQCLYFIFPVKGGAYDPVSKTMSYHQQTPTVSAERICMQSCGVGNRAIDGPVSDLTGGPLKRYSFDVEIEIMDERSQDRLKPRVKRAIESALRDINGFQGVGRVDLKRSQDGFISKVQVLFDKRKLVEKIEESPKEKVQGKLEEILSTGQMGDLRVNPQHLKLTDSQENTELEAEFKPEYEGEPEYESEAEVEGEPEYETEAEGEPEYETEAEGEPENESEAEGEPEYESEAEGEPEYESEAEGEPEYESEAEWEPEYESEAEWKPEYESEAEGEPEYESEAEGEPEYEPETESEVEPRRRYDSEYDGHHSPGYSYKPLITRPQYQFKPTYKPEPQSESEGGQYPYDDRRQSHRRRPFHHNRPHYYRPSHGSGQSFGPSPVHGFYPAYPNRRYYYHYPINRQGGFERHFHPLTGMIQNEYNSNYHSRKYDLLMQWAKNNGY